MTTATTPDTGHTTRSFLALPVPTEAVTYATLLQGVFREQGIRGRRVRPEAMHITVEFLGDQTCEALRRLAALLRRDLSEPALPVLDCLGPDTFGRPPSVLYVAWSDADFRFRRLAQAARGICRDAGLAPPAGLGKRKPVPHLTVLRLKDPQVGKALRKLRKNAADEAAWKPFLPPVPAALKAVELDRMELVASTLTPDGPVYRRLETFDLRAPATA